MSLPAVASCLAVLLAAACKKPEASIPPPPVVTVMEISTTAVPLTTLLIGQLDSPQNVQVRARVEGMVETMLFTEGSEVALGDMLFQLDKQPFEERLAAANGALAEANAALRKYQNDVARLAPLVARRALPQQDLDNAEASVEVGEAGVETAKARVETALLDLGYCEIKAPVAGLIGSKEVSIGDLVGKGEPTLMATISTLDPIWFYCNVSEVDYLHAREKSKLTGQQVEDVPLTLILSDGTEHSDAGKFVFIDRSVDSTTGTLRVRAEFPNREKLLRPGMFARVRVNMGKRPDTVMVPERALVELQGKSFVWLVREGDTVHQQPVVTGEQVGPRIIINEGLEAGDRIVLEGVHKLREGVPITIAPAAPESEQPPKE